jgi:riboflavin biosynthesis pyrimidine reductase
VRQLLPTPRDPVDPLEVYADMPAASGRPAVRVNMISSVDGATDVGGVSGPLGGPGDRRVYLTLRALCDVVLVGAGTVRAEGYGPHRPTDEQRAWRIDAGLAPTAAMAVVSAGLRLDLAAALFTEAEARTVVVAPARSDEAVRQRVAEVGDVVVAGEEAVDLAAALRAFRERGSRVVLCEGGPMLLGELLAAGLVDELCLTLAPMLVADPLRLLPDRALLAPHDMTLASVLEDDGHLFLRYLLTGTAAR